MKDKKKLNNTTSCDIRFCDKKFKLLECVDLRVSAGWMERNDYHLSKISENLSTGRYFGAIGGFGWLRKGFQKLKLLRITWNIHACNTICDHQTKFFFW